MQPSPQPIPFRAQYKTCCSENMVGIGEGPEEVFEPALHSKKFLQYVKKKP